MENRRITFADYLRSRRLKADLTLRELSTRSGINISVLCDLEMDKRSPKLEAIEKLAAAFGETVPLFLRRCYSK